MNLVAGVSVSSPRVFGPGNVVKVLAVDCGIKSNIIRCLVSKGAEVTLVPWDYDFSKVGVIDKYDGLFLSNGPGDPTDVGKTIKHLRAVMDNAASGKSPVKPIFGICLGNQLLALATEGGKTRKLPFGNRGQNQPVINDLTGECYITPQNHGYEVDVSSLPKEDWSSLFTNANDKSNEGIIHARMPYFSAQFHPEANCGPTDTDFLFDTFLTACRSKAVTRSGLAFPDRRVVVKKNECKKVLLLGSGGTSIGQAGEFDYSGAQAIKALKEEGIEVILMNPNIASVQTNVDGRDMKGKADQVFFLPVTPSFVEEVIKREKPDGIVISMGGQTALNCAIECWKGGMFEKYGVKVLGTQIPNIIDTEDRQLFSDRLHEIDEKIAKSYAVDNLEDAVTAAKDIGYPLMIRSAFALGGLGSGICDNEAMLRDMGRKALGVSPQILVERSMTGWKEVEYEVVRDAYDNCITVCNMENFDPLGVHTGDSIVVAPSQTLSNEEYHMLRTTALKVVRHLGIVGECNIQYALHPTSLEYCIIEVNARLSRSSALASKATGYPLAFVAAKLCLGIPLTSIQNAITKKTQACFEPSLDYVVTKIPRWDMGKFEGVQKQIGSAMKSVGEVMGIGRTIEESFQKALRMVEPSVAGFEKKEKFSRTALITEISKPTDRRVFAIAQALEDGELTVEEIHDLSKIDLWFLRRMERVAIFRRDVLNKSAIGDITVDQMRLAKQLGFSDKQIASAAKGGATTEDEVRAKRIAQKVTPFTKQIDTLAAEYPAETNYLYMTYHGMTDDVPAAADTPGGGGGGGGGGGVIVLGSGAYRIGSSIEFDWCGVSCIRALRDMGIKSTMINYNPETVSTDYDECDALYFEELSRERVLDIYHRDKADGVVVSVGGQIPNNLAVPLHKAGVKIMGTSAESIDCAEDRKKFSAMMDEIGCQQPEWKELTDHKTAIRFAESVKYPVLVRPSYVLSGAAMNVAWNAAQLEAYLKIAGEVSSDHPIVISKFIEGAKEIELDGVCKDGVFIAAAIHEHIENAGVHSGDATLVLPPQSLSAYQMARVRDAGAKIAKKLNITGPVNIQFIAKGSDVMVIETNLRASRSVPFVSKTMGCDFIEAATKAMVGHDTSDMNLPTLETRNRPANFVGVKCPMFSFTRLRGADPVLGVEMASTGEVACFGVNKEEAFLKSLLATGFKMPEKTVLVSVQDSVADECIHHAWKLHETGYELYATEKTKRIFDDKGVPCTLLHYPTEVDKEPNVLTYLREKKIDLCINIPTHETTKLNDNYQIRRTAVDFGVPLITNPQLMGVFADAANMYKRGEIMALKPDSLFEYYKSEKESDAWTGPKEFH